ncbi:unnamed protein product [Rodentolepis nana]|uniref:Tyrosine-protein kinase ephrin type A/B receptor-like domain-containing protein n=1 Tax=Rodentolepis nana TaxID=102285 RepID=A0A0R3TNA0_RODNA|nr:unnamed protein product [Rodentolepis nana]
MPPKAPFSPPRPCPPGTFMSKVPPIRCEPCPADTFSDQDTEPTDCLPCSAMRSTTHGSAMSSSLHCTNPLLDQERERLVRKFASRSPPDMLLLYPPIEDFDLFGNGSILNETELMDYLSPDPFLLDQQRVAVDLFKAITQLTFSDREIFGMILIAIALAVIIALLVFMVAITGHRTSYREHQESLFIRAEKWIIHRLHKLWLRFRRFFTKLFHRRRDNRPSWIRRKSMALKSGNIYKIQAAQAGENEANYYYQMRIKLKNIMLADPNFVERTEGEKNMNTRQSIYAEFKGGVPDIPDYTPIHKMKSSLRK